jgi:DNA-binding SARP family transcriptional activator
MTALYRVGRQADAPRVYHNLRELLPDPLGIDPGDVVNSRYQQSFSNEPGLDRSPATRHDRPRAAHRLAQHACAGRELALSIDCVTHAHARARDQARREVG